MEVDGSLSEGLESVENFALKFGSRVEVLVGNCMRFWSRQLNILCTIRSFCN